MIDVSKIIFRTGLCVAVAVAGGLSVGSLQAQTNVLSNSGFETGGYTSTGAAANPQVGTNIGTVPNSWAVAANYTASNSNLQRGSNTNQGVVLPVYSGAYSGGSTGSTGGEYYWDGTAPNAAPVTLTQTFTLTAASTNLSGTFALGGRDPGAASGNTTISITRTSGTSGTFAPFTSANFTTAEGAWQVKNFSLSAVPAGTYLFSINLAEPQNIDAVALVATPVPEPSTCAVIFGAGVLALGIMHRRRTMPL